MPIAATGRVRIRRATKPCYPQSYEGLRALSQDWIHGRVSRFGAMRQMRLLRCSRSFIAGLHIVDGEPGARGVGFSEGTYYCPKCGHPMSRAAGRYCEMCEAYR